jgi:hypothetical protein
MRVLLLHPEDSFHSLRENNWDLIVDLGRAPDTTYDSWRERAGCDVLSLYQFAEGARELDHLHDLLQLGLGSMIDHSGFDWWDLLCLFLTDDLRQSILIKRLSKELDATCELYASRPHRLASSLRRLLNTRLTILESPAQSAMRRASHYFKIISQFDAGHFTQTIEDKFDGDHTIRRLFARRRSSAGGPVILLPSAYINVSRTAISYAKLLPDHEFLLVHTRGNAELHSLPKNARATSLSPYFAPTNRDEIAALGESWDILRDRLVRGAEQFAMLDAAGSLGQIPRLFSWGIALRNAWNQVFACEDVTACLCADDSNAASSIPLLMAQKRGLPAIACHHGALDYQMAIKTNHADFYLAKSEMERDYLRRVGHLSPDRIVVAPVSSENSTQQIIPQRDAPWLVFFTEPYRAYGWRTDDVYRELLPRLCDLAQACSLKLVFKLHPFESVRGHRKMLRRLAPEHERHIDVISGPPTPDLWRSMRFAMTVQSSTALECAALGIPVFLCAWLRETTSGYLEQYARFGVGEVLQSVEEIAEVPHLLAQSARRSYPARPMADIHQVAELFSGTVSLPLVSNA